MGKTERRVAVVAIGGNALVKDDRQPNMVQQWDTVRETARSIVDLVAADWTVVVTHGNGPQVGYNLRRNELASPEVYPLSFDLLVAHTQGAIGYMLQQTIQNELLQRHITRPCVTILTQVRVEPDDPAFQRPTKPIGSFLNQVQAHQFELEGWQVIQDAGRGWRRVVASPEPVAIVEQAAIEQAVALGWIVIAVGGGGVPVVSNARGELRSVYAVVDKDRASALLASHMDSDLLLISTGVEKVALHFGQPNQRNLDQITLAEAQRYLAEGHFAVGSMKPKIEACIRFLEGSTKPNAAALITNPENLQRALVGATGTRLVKSHNV